MRGADITQESLFTTVHLETFVPANHPMRPIRDLFNQAMKRINWLLDGAYSEYGRESIPPEHLLRAQLLQVLYTIRSERQLVEQVSYNLLFRWFVGLSIDDEVWDHSAPSAKTGIVFWNTLLFRHCLKRWWRWRASKISSAKIISVSMAP